MQAEAFTFFDDDPQALGGRLRDDGTLLECSACGLAVRTSRTDWSRLVAAVCGPVASQRHLAPDGVVSVELERVETILRTTR